MKSGKSTERENTSFGIASGRAKGFLLLVALAVVGGLVACADERIVEVPVDRPVIQTVEVEVPVEFEREVVREVQVEVPVEVEREVVREVQVEVPVEVEREVVREVQVEVPVERTVEVPVEVEVPVVKNLIVNNLQECATSYDEGTDYFPDKTQAEYAQEWQVEYFNNYKVLTVDTDSNPDVQTNIRYVLVQCGTPTPDLSGELADAMVIEVPVQRFWEGGGAVFAALDALGVLDSLIGVNTRTSGSQNHFLPNVIARVEQDDVHKESSYGEDLELILDGEPDVYFQYNGNDWRNNALEVGVPAIHYSPFSEGPLGSAEQVKFVSLFFNLETRADRYFEPIAEEYNRIKELAQNQSENPTVLLGTIARSGQFQSRNRTRLESILIEDAGGERPLLKAVDQGFLDGTAHLGFGGVAVETALEHAEDAEYWFELAFRPRATNVPEYLVRNPLNSSFTALEQGNAFHRYGRAVDYHSTGAVRVDILLKDIISIIHPDLLPAHQLMFLDRIESDIQAMTLVSNPTGPVDEYNPTLDYFPDKVEVEHSKFWDVEYFSNYKVVTVATNDDLADPQEEKYVLVQKGTPEPELTGDLEGAFVFQVPIESLWEQTATMYAGHEVLGVADKLVGWSYIHSGIQHLPLLSRRAAAGEIAEVNHGPFRTAQGEETVIEIDPDVFIWGDQDRADRDAKRSVGIPIVFFDTFRENPLGSAEGVKFTALWYNLEASANQVFRPIEQRYLDLKQLAGTAEVQPSVLVGNISSAGFTTRPSDRIESFLIADAGGQRILSDDQLDFGGFFPSVSLETAIEQGADADFWFGMHYVPSQQDAAEFIAADPLNENFTALGDGRMFHRFGPRGEDYFVTGGLLVDVLFADIVSILHPDLLPDHAPVFLQPVPGLDE